MNIKKFPGFGKVFAEVNKRWDPYDKSINQQCKLTYDYLKEWYSLEEESLLLSSIEDFVKEIDRFFEKENELIRLKDKADKIKECLTKYKEEPEPLPCPFCGGEAKLLLIESSSSFDLWEVACQNYNCNTKILNSVSKEEAIKKWNNRINKE